MGAASLLPAAAYAENISSPYIQTSAGKTVKWTVTSSFPKSLDTLYGGAEYVARQVAAMTDNKFQISVFAAGELAPALGALDITSNGTVDACHTTSYYYVGKNPAFAIGSCLPFGMNARQQIGWMTAGNGLETMQSLYDDYNIVGFPAGNTGAQMGGWLRKELNTIEDVKGLKIRIGGLAGEVFQKIGAIPQQIAGSDIYPALEKGVIDAAEWVGPYDDEKLGFHKIVPYYYYPGWWEGGPNIHFFVNKTVWEELPKDYQHIFKSACTGATLDMLTKYDALNGDALRRIAATGTKIKKYPENLLKSFYNVAFGLYEELSLNNDIFAAIYKEHEAFRKKTMLSYRFSDAHFDHFMINNS
ncbi:MAG: TRAP transporter substrate-binding protein DctP [Pseudomonadota bacterium]